MRARGGLGVLGALGVVLVVGVTASLGDMIGSTLANDPTTSGPCTGQAGQCVAFQETPPVVAESAGKLTAFRVKKKDGDLSVRPGVLLKKVDGSYTLEEVGDVVVLPTPAGTYDETLTTPLSINPGEYPAVVYAAGGPKAYHVTYHPDASFILGYSGGPTVAEGTSFTPLTDKYELLVQWTITPSPTTTTTPTTTAAHGEADLKLTNVIPSFKAAIDPEVVDLLTVQNVGTVDATGVTLETALIPEWHGFQGFNTYIDRGTITPSRGSCTREWVKSASEKELDAHCHLETLAPGASATVHIVLSLRRTRPGGFSSTGTADATNASPVRARASWHSDHLGNVKCKPRACQRQ